MTMESEGVAPTNKIKVTVVANPPGTNPKTMFSLTWKNENDPQDPGKKGDIDLPPLSGSCQITFHLDDKSGLRLNFAPTAEQAMYVSIGSCEDKPGNGGQIIFDQVDLAKKTLRVADSNCGPPCDLHYQLNFFAPDGTHYPYDPIIKNGGGPSVLFR